MAETRRELVVVFDLDDTLYPEIAYVESGFRAVAHALEARFGAEPGQVFALLCAALERHGRGETLDIALRELGVYSRGLVRRLVHAYRHHDPDLTLPDESRRVLSGLAGRAAYLVTDGHKVVQARKIEALGIARHFRHCYLTRRYGLAREKPCPYVFQRIAAREGCKPERVVYVGDDPHKDFCGIRPLGFRTLRVRSGRHARVEVPAERDAELSVDSISQVPEALTRWEDAA